MRMEELSQNRSIKTPDTVEKYLLSLVQTYFSGGNNIPETSREHIINQAVSRMKEELRLDSMGVTSIIINGEERIGAVKVTLEDLEGEPRIDSKYNAFNVNFGTEKGTACEGNDPRLSDARKPLSHQHTTADIVGLDGIISSLTGKVQRIDGLIHGHKNKDILDKITYTGNKTTIDLSLLDNLKDDVFNLVSEIRKETTDYKKEINDKAIEIESEINTVDGIIDSLKQFIINTNENYYIQAEQYTDTKYNELKDSLSNSIDGFAEKLQLTNLLSLANQSIGMLGTFSFRVSQSMDLSANLKKYTGVINIPDDIRNKLDELGLGMDEYMVEFLLSYIESRKVIYAPLPYLILNDGIINGSLNIEYDEDSVYANYSCNNGAIPSEIQNGTIICNIYSKQGASV